MTHDYKLALHEIPDGSDINELDVWAFKHRNAIKKALELAIALQSKPISEAAMGQWVLTYNPVAELVRDDKYELKHLKENDLRYAHPRTHFYDISALPKPEVIND